jgi:hypothetical protein
MYESNLRVVKYEPLTFQCVHCDQQFAPYESLERLGADVSSHIHEKHPQLLHDDPQQRVA